MMSGCFVGPQTILSYSSIADLENWPLFGSRFRITDIIAKGKNVPCTELRDKSKQFDFHAKDCTDN